MHKLASRYLDNERRETWRQAKLQPRMVNRCHNDINDGTVPQSPLTSSPGNRKERPGETTLEESRNRQRPSPEDTRIHS